MAEVGLLNLPPRVPYSEMFLIGTAMVCSLMLNVDGREWDEHNPALVSLPLQQRTSK